MNKLGSITAHLDEGISPKNDLFRHVNGGWLTSCDIPADKSAWGSFYELREKVDLQVKTIVDDISGLPSNMLNHEERLVKELYRSYMDVEAINKVSNEKIKVLINKIDRVSTLAEFFATLGELELYEGGGLFHNFISFDDKNSKRFIAHFAQGGLSLPDKDYYSAVEHAPIREKFIAHINKMYSFFGIAKEGVDILDFESKIADFSWDQVALRDTEAGYNILTFGVLKEKFCNIDFNAFLKALGVNLEREEEVIVSQPSFFEGLNTLLEEVDINKFKEWAVWSLISGVAPYVNDEIKNENFNFWGKEFDGVDEMEPRWKYAVEFVDETVGEVIGKEYINRHYSDRAAEKMNSLIKNLILAYEDSIKNLAWMGDETKLKALEKLSKFNPKVGAPSKWEDFSDLTLDEGGLLLDHIKILNQYSWKKEYKELREEIDRERWFTTPHTVNAYYQPNLNEIVFPAGILQAPFFDEHADDAVNYGAIGAIIGHEIGHGFDDQGSKFDGEGNLVSWWSESDRENFDKLTKNLIDQFEGLSPSEAPEAKVNGSLTIGENIGDLAGLAIAYKAYKLSKAFESEIYIAGLSGAKRFFMGWAGAWRIKERGESMANSLLTDPHSPAEFRCNQIIRNLDAFYEAFEVCEGDALYLEPELRVRIW